MSMENLRAGDLEALSDYGDEIAGMVNGARRKANGKVKAASGLFKKGLGKAAGGSREALARAKDGAADLYDQLDDVLRARPMVTLGVGLAVGAALGIAVGRLLDARDD